MSQEIKVKAEPRSTSGSTAARRLRRAGQQAGRHQAQRHQRAQQALASAVTLTLAAMLRGKGKGGRFHGLPVLSIWSPTIALRYILASGLTRSGKPALRIAP